MTDKMAYIASVYDCDEEISIGVFTSREIADEYLANMQFMVYGNVESATPKEYFDAVADGKDVTPALMFFLNRNKMLHWCRGNIINPITSVASYRRSKDCSDRYILIEEKLGLRVVGGKNIYVDEVPLDCITKDWIING